MNARRLLAPLGLLAMVCPPLSAQLIPGSTPSPRGPKGGGASSIVVNPLDDSEVLITRLNQSIPIHQYQLYRSTDSGQSFSVYHSPALSGAVRGLMLDPRDNQTLYILSDSDLLRSTDFGATWTDLGVGAASGLNEVIAPSTGTNLYARTYNVLYRSNDNGSTWTAVPLVGPPSFSCLAVAPTDQNTLYLGTIGGSGSAGRGIWKSTDAGTTWTQPDPTFNEWIRALAVSPFNADIFHAGTTSCCSTDEDKGVWRSFDGGVTMTKTGDITDWGTASFLQYDPAGHYLYVGMQPDIAWSTDLGDTWTMADAGLPDIGVLPERLGFDSAGNRYMPAQGNNVSSNTGGGLYWMPTGPPTGWFHLGFSDSSIGDIAVSTPGGPRYAAAGSIYRALPGADFEEAPAIQAAVTAMLVDPSDPSKLLAASLGANQKMIMWLVSDWGDTALQVYQSYSTGPVEDIALDPNNPLNAIAVKNTNGWGTVGILYSPLGGNGWNELGPTTGWGAREVAYDPHTPGRAVVLMDGPALSESFDGGQTWSAPAPLWVGGGQVAGLEFDPFLQGVIYAGDETGGLHRSGDDGATWTALGIGLHRGSEVEVHPQMPGLLWVSDDAAAIQVSGDRGATWDQGSFVFGGSNATGLALDTADGSLLFGTQGDSAWEQPQASPFVRLGAGTAGTGGFVPRLWAEGSLPRMTSGSPGFTIGGDRTVGFDGANSNLPGVVVPVLGFGSFPVPFIGGTWYPSILLPTVQLPVVLGAGTPGVGGTGSWTLPVPLPADPSLVGGLLVFQCVVLDEGAPDLSGWVLSDAISVLLIP
jgi:hypothetical protein